MEKVYLHPCARREGHRLVCYDCGAELDDWMWSPRRCPVLWREAVPAGGVLWAVAAWEDDEPELQAFDRDGTLRSFRCLDERLARALDACVREGTGSGQRGAYVVPDGLADLVEEGIASGRLVVER